MKDTKKTQKWLESVYAERELIKKLEKVFETWKGKFGENFKNHLTGDVGVKKITENGKNIYKITLKGQGGHIVNEFVEIVEIKIPPGFSRVEDIPLDTPFVCIINVKSNQGQLFPKSAKSSVFPHNWSYERIQQEIAWVYENTVAKGAEPDFVNSVGHQFYDGLSTAEFKVRIEIKEGNIINSYPKI